MAEILGVVAGGVGIAGFAAQIISSVQQIQDFWSSIRDAPADIKSLLDELTLLSEMLDDIDIDEQTMRGQVVATKAARYCQTAAKSIDAVVRDLADGLQMTKGRKQWAAVKAVLKEKRMARSLQQLERAKAMLILAYQCYIHTDMRLQIKALKESQRESQRQMVHTLENFLSSSEVQRSIVNTASGQTTSIGVKYQQNETATASDQIRYGHLGTAKYWSFLGIIFVRSRESCDTRTEKEAEMQGKEIQFRPPLWMFTRGLTILSTKVYGHWQYLFRSYRIITLEDPLFVASICGDLDRVKRLCAEGKATPFDTTSDGWSLLHIAAATADPALCRWVISQGLDGNVRGGIRYKPPEDNREWKEQYYGSDTTPLQVAANFSGRENGLFWGIARHPEAAVYDNRALPDNSDRPDDVMDTLRLLVENGHSDVMATRGYGWTALHDFSGTWEQYSYLLNQNYSQIDLLDFDESPNSITEWHCSIGWPASARIAKETFDESRLLVSKGQSHPYFTSFNVHLLLSSASNLVRGYHQSEVDRMYALSLFKEVVASGIDLHATRYTSTTALDQFFTLSPREVLGDGPVDENAQNSIQRVKDKSIPNLKLWLLRLKEANVDLEKYISEEKQIATTKAEQGWWRTDYCVPGYFVSYMREISDDEWNLPYRAEWQIELEDGGKDFSIKVEYVFKNVAETESRLKAPGGWVDDD